MFKNSGAVALRADGANITSSAFLDEGFSAEGQVRFPGARIGGQLVCSRGVFENPEGCALSTYTATITGGVFLTEGFRAVGIVVLEGAQIGSDFVCRGIFKNPEGDALVAEGMNVRGTFCWQPKDRAEGVLNVRNAHVGRYVDAKVTWPTARTLALEGFAMMRSSQSQRTSPRPSASRGSAKTTRIPPAV